MDFTIRPLEEKDRKQWELLWKGYQDFYEVDLDELTDDTWQRLIKDTSDGPFCIVAESSGALVGIVQYLFHGTTWTPRQRIYLNDLFTTKEARGKGVGRALIEAVYEVGRKRDAECVYWLTQDFNTTARALYDRVAEKTPFIKYSHYL